MSDFVDEYAATGDPTDRYRLLRAELTRLRGDVVAAARDEDRSTDAYYDPDAVAETVRELSDRVDGDLIVFTGNDFGMPRAFRPEGTDRDRQDDVRQAILREKYDDDQADLAAIRDELLDRHPQVHKAVVAVVDGDEVRYHLPEGSNETTGFLTVREMVGLVDYVTNSAQAAGMSLTY